ncbi:MAG: hypothetical protein DLM61_06765 [Pseudonocardiales bacterium]|nr:MAG: hypothetical protein DLM61_06765 [Pseudonocardiales bacterium]
MPSPALLVWSPNALIFRALIPSPPRPTPPSPPTPPLPPRPPPQPPALNSDRTVRAGSSSTCCPSISTKPTASDMKSS